jgi:hypothetical protein
MSRCGLEVNAPLQFDEIFPDGSVLSSLSSLRLSGPSFFMRKGRFSLRRTGFFGSAQQK